MKFYVLPIIVACASGSAGCRKATFIPPSVFSHLLQPGAVIEIYSGPTNLEVVCTQEEATGEIKAVSAEQASASPAARSSASASATSDGEVVEFKEPDFTSSSKPRTEAQVTLDANVTFAINFLEAKGRFKHVNKISYVATNVKRLAGTYAALSKGARDGLCNAGIKNGAVNGHLLNLVTQVFMANIAYTVELEADASAGTKTGLLSLFAESFGGKVVGSESGKIEATSVTWLGMSIPYGIPRR